MFVCCYFVVFALVSVLPFFMSKPGGVHISAWGQRWPGLACVVGDSPEKNTCSAAMELKHTVDGC